MHIESIKLRNFRCFGNVAAKIELNSGIMGFVGDNGAGKSSSLEALKRLFSPISSEHKIRRSDVHFGPGEDSRTVAERQVVIDVVFAFSDARAIPHVFNDVFFNAGDSSLKVRVTLEAKYTKAESIEDDIETSLFVVRTLDDVPFGPDDERKIPLRGKATQFAELVYIPAHRDSMSVTHHALKNVLRRLERSADWHDDTKNKSQSFAEELDKSLNDAPAVKAIVSDLKAFWTGLHDGHYDADPRLSVVATDFEKLIRELTLRFEKSPGGGQRQLEELSEGQVSLLYFALSATLHSLIWKMEDELPDCLDGFKALDFVPAPLTIFALEEPENHLAPFYLPKLISLLEKLQKHGNAQSLVTSHSTSVLSRIKPRNVRYFRNCRKTLISDIRPMPLPISGTDEDKFVQQTLLANPEIYFARLIIVGEGDSERIVIPRIAEALGFPLDPSFIAFVPIGGRHAQHIWKLAWGLNIPCLTLLDFDLGRYAAGMGRIKNATDWLNEAGWACDPKAAIPKNEEVTKENLPKWAVWLRGWNLFYSTYLDLDMMMIQAFPDVYATSEEYDSKKDETAKIEKSVFGKSGQGRALWNKLGVNVTDQELFKYKKLFKSASKPASHLEALGKLDDKTIIDQCPEPLKALVDKARELISPTEHGGA